MDKQEIEQLKEIVLAVSEGIQEQFDDLSKTVERSMSASETKINSFKPVPGKNGINGLNGKNGKDGINGKDGTSYTAKELVDMFQSLEGDDRLDASAIKNLPTNSTRLAKDGYPYGLPQPAAAITYQINGTQAGRGNILNIQGTGIQFVAGPDKGTYIINGGAAGGEFLIGQTSGLISNPAPGASDEVWLGFHAGFNTDPLTQTFGSTFFGFDTGDSATGAAFATFIGYQSGYHATNAVKAMFLGYQAGYTATDANYSAFIGTGAGYHAFNAGNASFIGYEAGRDATQAAESLFMGYQSGYASTNASQSIFMGFFSGYTAPNAAFSIFLGYRAGLFDTVDNTSGLSSSILIGDYTSTGGFSDSIALGAIATNTQSNELMIGSAARPINFTTIIGTGATTLQVGTTGQRPSTPVAGMIRFNTTTSKHEGYDGAVWQNFY